MEGFLGKTIIPESNSCELYFEEQNIERFVEKLERLYPNIQYVNRLMTHSWGQKVIRFYDLDGNLIEVGTTDCNTINFSLSTSHRVNLPRTFITKYPPPTQRHTEQEI